MNVALSKIASLTHKPRTIIGLMSGTSLDGLDIALCKLSNHGLSTSLTVERFTSVSYSAEFLSTIRPLFANPEASLKNVTKANAWVAREHASMLMEILEKWAINSDDVDILASHGQTIFHAPNSLRFSKSNKCANKQTLASATLQIGDGDHLAFLTQILTVSDFRQKHIAAMGEGAPLVPYADYLLFSDVSESRILVNIGGIANFTYIPKNAAFNEVVSADTGPGNTLMDAVVTCAKKLSDEGMLAVRLPAICKLYDANGDFASTGKIDELLLDILLTSVDNRQMNQDDSNKTNNSTGQEIYNLDFINIVLEQRMKESLHGLTSSSLISYLNTSQEAFHNLIATLNLFTAKTISAAVNNLHIPTEGSKTTTIYLSGGGVHNSVLVENIRNCIQQIPVKCCDKLGINPDAKEAALFAVLANQTLFGSSEVFANNKGIPATAFGKISLP